METKKNEALALLNEVRHKRDQYREMIYREDTPQQYKTVYRLIVKDLNELIKQYEFLID
jgi:hypothetical protein